MSASPRQTDERLRSWLDTNQLDRERLCLAVMALGRRFTDVRPRQPRGGADGARDLEAMLKDGRQVWGAIGFQNTVSDTQPERTQASKKFSLDLASALAENSDLRAFVFFTNVNLTVDDERDLIAHAKAVGIEFCDIFDRERIRIVLDSPDGLLAREQYLDIPMSAEGGKSTVIQSSKIASCSFPLKFPKKTGTKERDPEIFVKYVSWLLESFCRCFGHTCVLTGAEDFVFLLTLEKSERETDPDYIAYDLEVVCHITEFVRALEERLKYLMQGGAGPVPRLKTLPGDQTFEKRLGFGRDMPHRIYRLPPTDIVMECVDTIPSPPSKVTTTSNLLCLLAAAFKKKVFVCDNAETYPDLGKVMMMFERTERAGFAWDGIRLDPDNPESWEYFG